MRASGRAWEPPMLLVRQRRSGADCSAGTHAAPRQFELEKLLGFRRYDDAVQVIRPAIEFERRADVKSEIRRRLLQDLARRHRYPCAVDQHLVMIIDLPT